MCEVNFTGCVPEQRTDSGEVTRYECVPTEKTVTCTVCAYRTRWKRKCRSKPARWCPRRSWFRPAMTAAAEPPTAADAVRVAVASAVVADSVLDAMTKLCGRASPGRIFFVAREGGRHGPRTNTPSEHACRAECRSRSLAGLSRCRFALDLMTFHLFDA